MVVFVFDPVCGVSRPNACDSCTVREHLGSSLTEEITVSFLRKSGGFAPARRLHGGWRSYRVSYSRIVPVYCGAPVTVYTG
jgi:hypothetical protein